MDVLTQVLGIVPFLPKHWTDWEGILRKLWDPSKYGDIKSI